MAEEVASEAPAFSVVADVAIVKGETPAQDRTWLSFPDGTARREAARTAVNAVVSRWGDGPDTPAGVRARLRKAGPDAAELAGRLSDEQLRVAGAGVRRLYRDWAALPVGGTLRATWPLHDSWLRLR